MKELWKLITGELMTLAGMGVLTYVEVKMLTSGILLERAEILLAVGAVLIVAGLIVTEEAGRE